MFKSMERLWWKLCTSFCIILPSPKSDRIYLNTSIDFERGEVDEDIQDEEEEKKSILLIDEDIQDEEDEKREESDTLLIDEEYTIQKRGEEDKPFSLKFRNPFTNYETFGDDFVLMD